MYGYTPDGKIISIHTPTKGVTKGVEKMGKRRSISIHTPTKGVTVLNFCIIQVSNISIHTPTKGVTISQYRNYKIQCNFNPHSHEGSDLPALMMADRRINFNPHSHEGSDSMTEINQLFSVQFQSTLPRRE